MTNYKISIIVPIYKVEDLLSRCIESLVNQTYTNLEIILVDDGSPDSCGEICDKYSLTDSRIVVIHKHNGGLSDARNAGLEKATGDFVLYVDSDDYIELDACERLTEYVNEEVDIVIGACKEINNNKISYQRHSNINPNEVLDAKKFVVKSILNKEWYAPAWLNLYKTSFLKINNLYFQKGIIHEDVQILPHLFLSAKKVVYVDYPFYNYIIRENSIMTSNISEQKINSVISIYNDWSELFQNVRDYEYQRYLYSALVRYYLGHARRYRIVGWSIDGINAFSAFKYALGVKDKIKVAFYSLAPKLYVRL